MRRCLGTPPETNIAPENGWLEYYFPMGRPIFRGYVSFREGTQNPLQNYLPEGFFSAIFGPQKPRRHFLLPLSMASRLLSRLSQVPCVKVKTHKQKNTKKKHGDFCQRGCLYNFYQEKNSGKKGDCFCQ